jgi:hypothetical protein
LICFIVFYQLNGSLLSSTKIANQTPNPSSIDTVNDGVYTNHRYGFMFKYPTDKFEQEVSMESWGSWIYVSEAGPYIKLSAYVYEGQTYQDHKMLFERNRTHQNKNYKLLNEGETDKYKTAITYSMTDLNIPIDGNSSYSAYWWSKDDDKVIRLDFYSSNYYDTFVKANKNLFDEIVQSFKFF